MTIPRPSRRARYPCIECGEPSPGTRCAACHAEQERKRSARANARRGSARELGYDGAWRRLSARARKLTPWCADAHLGECAGQLSTDHLPGAWEKRARGERLTLLDVEVVCLRHNGQRGARRSRGAM